ncbi:transposon protein, putative, CACTA, En/Spm sub-class [Hordeum vulgare]|nr:transposon protein, putative, CACTA, En/Spm sub-class [Hordeum vulgare]
MTIHLCNNGFMLGYERWTSHGESVVPENVEHDNVGDGDRMNDMLVDAIVAEGVSKGDEPTKAAKKFFEMLMEADKPLHDKTTQSHLSIVGRLMTIKTQHNLSEACYNDMMSLIHDIVGDDAAKDLPANFHSLSNLDDYTNDPSTTDEYFQEDGQLGSFSVDADQFVDESTESRKEADDVELDPSEIEIIENQNNNVEGEDSAEDELEDSSDEEEENLPEEEGQEETYETEDEDDAIERDSEYDDDDY